MERWNATYDHMNRVNPKSAHYLSMEYLQVSRKTTRKTAPRKFTESEGSR